jgi:hypothetical protein
MLGYYYCISPVLGKIRGFAENVKIHPIILVKLFPQLYVLARRTRLPASFFV